MSNAINNFGSWTTFSDPNNNIHNVHQVFVVPTRPGPTIAVCGGHGVTAASAIEVKKRAALIAAAPELLEALGILLNRLEGIGGEHVTGMEGVDADLIKANAVIAKATGV